MRREILISGMVQKKNSQYAIILDYKKWKYRVLASATGKLQWLTYFS